MHYIVHASYVVVVVERDMFASSGEGASDLSQAQMRWLGAYLRGLRGLDVGTPIV